MAYAVQVELQRRHGRAMISSGSNYRALVHRLLGVVALVVVVVAVACSSSSGSGQPSAAADEFALDAVFIELFGTADTEAYRTQIRTEANELAVTCMQKAGYEYVLAPTPPENPTEAQLESSAFLLENGFGIVSTFRTWLESTDLEAQREDPNQAYLATLTAAEIEQFMITLQGVPAEPGQLQTETGCAGAAADQAYGRWEAFYDALPNYTGVGEERDTHPDWLAARELWSACMADQGYDYSEPMAIASDVRTRMQAGIAEVYPDGTVPIEFDGDRWSLSPEVVPLLDQWQRFETDAAAAHVGCSEPLSEKFDAVEREVQQGFVDRNRTVIDELIARFD